MRVVSLSFFQGLTEDYRLGASHSVALSKLLQRRRKGAMNFLAKTYTQLKHTSWQKINKKNFKKINVNRKQNQVNDFNAFPCTGRCKKLGSLEFFLRYAS